MILKRLDGILELAGGLFVLLTGKNRDAAGSRMRRILADGMLVQHTRKGSVDQPHRAAHRLQPWIGDGRFPVEQAGTGSSRLRVGFDCNSDPCRQARIGRSEGESHTDAKMSDRFECVRRASMSKQAERVRVPRSSIEPPGAAPVRARPVGRRWTTLWTRDRGRPMTRRLAPGPGPRPRQPSTVT